MKATFVKNMEDWNGDARLYHLENDTYVVVSAANIFGPETYMFSTDSNGEPISWEEVYPGSFRGELNHERSLNEAGLELQ